MSAGIARHHRKILREHVHNLALALVAPLRADDDCRLRFQISLLASPELRAVLTLLARFWAFRKYKRTAAGGVPPNHTVLLTSAQSGRGQRLQRLLRHLAIAFIGKSLR